jgi:hypothetical protein
LVFLLQAIKIIAADLKGSNSDPFNTQSAVSPDCAGELFIGYC